MNSFCADIILSKYYKSKTVIRETLDKTLLYEKAAHKMLMNLTQGQFHQQSYMLLLQTKMLWH